MITDEIAYAYSLCTNAVWCFGPGDEAPALPALYCKGGVVKGGESPDRSSASAGLHSSTEETCSESDDGLALRDSDVGEMTSVI